MAEQPQKPDKTKLFAELTGAKIKLKEQPKKKAEALVEPDELKISAPAWLTYETQFNHAHFRKSSGRSKLGVYAMPLSNCKIWMRRDLHDKDSALLAHVFKVFFPDLSTPEILLDLSCSKSPWWEDPCSHKTPVMASPKENSSSRDKAILAMGPMVLMPYNFDENDSGSATIGTIPLRAGSSLVILDPQKHFLECWHTASRSCITEVREILSVGEMNKNRVNWDKVWPAELLETWPFPESRQAKPDLETRFEDKQLDPKKIFSIKMGVRYVGQVQQEGKKGFLGADAIVGLLLSDYVVTLRKAGLKEEKWLKHLAILTELLTVVERPNETDKDWEAFLDGFQLRDLTGMRADRTYVCPISIPYFGKDWKTRVGRYEELHAGASVWQEHFAKAVGRAKAYMLLGYGLQGWTPNAQNFLIECLGSSPTGKVIVRDLGDLKLHAGVVQYFGDVGMSFMLYLQDKGLGHLTNFTPDQSAKWTKMGYPGGAHPLWHFYTALARGFDHVKLPSTLTDRGIHDEGWQTVLEVNCAWGLAHNQAYVTTIADALKIEIDIPWGECPKPSRYAGTKSASDANDLWLADYAFETDVVAAAVDLALSENKNAIYEFAFG